MACTETKLWWIDSPVFIQVVYFAFWRVECQDFCLASQEVETGGLSPEVGAAIRKYLDRADVVLLTQLRSKASGKVVTIGNIHVVWDFMRSPDVQCIQVATVRSQKSSTVLFVFVNCYKNV